MFVCVHLESCASILSYSSSRQSSIAEIKSYSNPQLAIQEVMRATLLLLGEEEDELKVRQRIHEAVPLLVFIFTVLFVVDGTTMGETRNDGVSSGRFTFVVMCVQSGPLSRLWGECTGVDYFGCE